MMERLEARGRDVAARGIGRAGARIRDALEDGGIGTERTEDGVVVRGRGLRGRIGWIGGLLR